MQDHGSVEVLETNLGILDPDHAGPSVAATVFLVALLVLLKSLTVGWFTVLVFFNPV